MIEIDMETGLSDFDRFKRNIQLMGEFFHPAFLKTSESIRLLIAMTGDHRFLGDFRCPTCGHRFRVRSMVQELFYNGYHVLCAQCRKKFNWRTVANLEGSTLKPAELAFYAMADIVGMSKEERIRRLTSPPPKVKKEHLN